MKALVLLNPGAGVLLESDPAQDAARVAARFHRHGIDADVRTVHGPDIEAHVRRALASPDIAMIVAGGGDGTLNAVASLLVNTGRIFAALPLGTLNHLAKELRMPEDLDAAIDAIGTGSAHAMNIGEVNGRPFLLFSAIGLYADIVKHRDAQRRALGRKKWPAMFIAALRMLTRFPLIRVKLTTSQGSWRRLTPAVFISISEYQKELFGVDGIPCRDRQGLDLFVAARTSRLGALWLLLKAFLGLVKPLRDYEALCLDEFQIDLRQRHLRVGIDGEIVSMETPLNYRLRRGALRVMLPGPAQ